VTEGRNGVRERLVDAYCRGVFPGELGLAAFEAMLPGAAAPGSTLFDSPAGFDLRRWCPPLLGLEPHCPPARYLARRRELGAFEAVRLLLRGAGLAGYLLDTGEPGDLAPPKELAAAAGAPAYELVRLGPLAQQVADTSGTVDAFLANLAEAVHGAALSVTGFVCDDCEDPVPDDRPPGPGQVRRAVARWLGGRTVRERPADPVLLRHLRWHAVATGLPLVLRHAAAGAGPRAAEGFLRAVAGVGTDVVLLPRPAHETAAAELAAALPHVYVAVSGDPAGLLARTPFGKLLYAGGAAGLPELYVAGAARFRAALDRAVAARVDAGEWSAADGQRVAALVGAGNARRVYRLPEPAAGVLPSQQRPGRFDLGTVGPGGRH
jgi:hypothetical protein